ncbi:hypothetical protein AOLI_G00166210 [Acnodon oligacanthus]
MEDLLNIRQSMPQGIFPHFSLSDCFLDILVSGAAALYSRRRRGRRAGALVKLHRAEFTHRSTAFTWRMFAPLLLSQLCLTESTPDSALQPYGFNLYRVDRPTELSGKKKGSGICFYINQDRNLYSNPGMRA